MKMRKTVAIGMVLLLIAARFVVPMNVYAIDPATGKGLTRHTDDEDRIRWEFDDNCEEDAAVVTVIVITLAVVGTAASILAWLGGGEDPDAETYAYANAGGWFCGEKGSESDEAFLPDVSAESNAGEFSCKHGAKARAHVKAWWEQVEGNQLKGKIEKGPIYANAHGCHAKAEAWAELKGITKWEKEIGSLTNPDDLLMQLTMNFTEFSVSALDNPDEMLDENSYVGILIEATWGLETWTLFDGLLVNDGMDFVATGSFEELDLIRSEDGSVTFSSWPTIDVDFYVPEGEEIAITGSVISDVMSSVPVGGIAVPVDKFGLLAPYVGLASTIIVATAATAIYVKHVKRRNGKR